MTYKFEGVIDAGDLDEIDVVVHYDYMNGDVKINKCQWLLIGQKIDITFGLSDKVLEMLKDEIAANHCDPEEEAFNACVSEQIDRRRAA